MVRRASLRNLSALTTVVAGSLLTLTACGSAGSTTAGGAATSSTATLSPTAAAHAGLAGLEKADALTFTLKLDAGPQQLAALEKAGGASAQDGQVASRILQGGSVVLAVKAGGGSFAADAKDPADAAREAFSLDVDAGDQPDLVQVVDVDRTLYARADAQVLASYFGAAGQRTLQQLTSASTAAKAPFLAKAVAGGWLKLDLGGALTSPGGGSTTAAGGQLGALRTALATVFDDDVTVTRGPADPALGDHLVLTGSTRKIGTDLVSALKTSLGTVPGVSSLLAKVDPATLPAKDVTVDAYVKDGAVDAVRLDLTQLFGSADQAAVGGQPIDLELDVATSATVTAPAASTTVGIPQLLPLLGALGGGSALTGL